MYSDSSTRANSTHTHSTRFRLLQVVLMCYAMSMWCDSLSLSLSLSRSLSLALSIKEVRDGCDVLLQKCIISYKRLIVLLINKIDNSTTFYIVFKAVILWLWWLFSISSSSSRYMWYSGSFTPVLVSSKSDVAITMEVFALLMEWNGSNATLLAVPKLLPA